MEGEETLPESQTGFRKQKLTMDNVFVLNHLAQRKKGNRKGILFVRRPEGSF